MATYTFTPRWKEELVCTCDVTSRKLVFELPMGVMTAYFPTEEAWLARAPAWAKDKREEILADLRTWCASMTPPTPLIIDATAGITEDR
jgi:hypothetical protein